MHAIQLFVCLLCSHLTSFNVIRIATCFSFEFLSFTYFTEIKAIIELNEFVSDCWCVDTVIQTIL